MLGSSDRYGDSEASAVVSTHAPRQRERGRELGDEVVRGSGVLAGGCQASEIASDYFFGY